MIRSVFTVDDEGQVQDDNINQVPYLQLRTWRDLQMNNSLHTKLMRLIKNGQEPDRRKTGGENTLLKNMHTMYLKDNLKVHSSGVIMVRQKLGHFQGFVISVPPSIFPGIAFFFHNKLQHPRRGQLLKFLSRYFYVSAMPAVIDKITDACLQCASTRHLPKALVTDTTTVPTAFGTHFAADVIERETQAIYICKEILTQHVTAILIPDQTTNSLRQAIVQSVAPYVNISGAEIRVDPAPAFQSLEKSQLNDPIFKALNIKLKP